MLLIVGGISGGRCEALLSLLELRGYELLRDLPLPEAEALLEPAMAGHGRGRSRQALYVSSLEMIASMATRQAYRSEIFLLLAYVRPETFLLDAMGRHRDPEVSLQEWHEGALRMRALHEQCGDRAVLVEVDTLLAGWDALVERVEPPTDRLLEQTHRLLAEAWISRNPGVPELLRTLEAAARLPVRGEVEKNLPQAARQEVEMLRLHLAAERLKVVQEENALLLLQLHQAREKLEKLHLRQVKPAKAKELPLQESLSVKMMKESWSWRITAPLRYLGYLAINVQKGWSRRMGRSRLAGRQ